MSIPLFTAKSTRAIDKAAIDSLEIPGFELMQRAADFCFSRLLHHFPRAQRLTVLCGKGNNAGDAYLVAHKAHTVGMKVRLIAVEDPALLQSDAALAWQVAKDAGLIFEDFTPGSLQAEDLQGRDCVVIDGLLGTGIQGQVRERYAQAIDEVNRARAQVLSVDIPSGVVADNGAVAGTAIQAAVTTTFIAHKIGLFTGAGSDRAGLVEFSDLGVPAYLAKEHPSITLLSWDPTRLEHVPRDAHKTRRGHVLVVGGDHGMPGSVTLAAEAALRAGAGLVTVATREGNTLPIVARRPEAMTVNADQPDALDAALSRATVIVLGPGLGRHDWGQQLFARIISRKLPTVIDADGLYWLAERGEALPFPAFLSPHAGEAARLLNSTAGAVDDSRIESAAKMATKYDAAVVLKGPGSVIVSKTGTSICAHGNPGMASAGTGDVLAGTIGGFLAQAPVDDLDQAFANAVLLHSAAGDAAANRLGERSVLASDLIAEMPALLR